MRRTIIPCTFALLIGNPSGVSADSFPSRKSGLWEVTVNSSTGMQPQTMTECVDSATDAQMMRMSTDMSKSMGANCSKNEFKSTDSGFESTSECVIAGSTMSSKGVFSGDFTSSYVGEVTVSFSPPLHGQRSSKTTFSAKFKGACSSEMEPGEMMVNGVKLNSLKMASQAKDIAKALSKDAQMSAGDAVSADQLEAIRKARQQMENME